jgi:hypothetical protein
MSSCTCCAIAGVAKAIAARKKIARFMQPPNSVSSFQFPVSSFQLPVSSCQFLFLTLR